MYVLLLFEHRVGILANHLGLFLSCCLFLGANKPPSSSLLLPRARVCAIIAHYQSVRPGAEKAAQENLHGDTRAPPECQ